MRHDDAGARLPLPVVAQQPILSFRAPALHRHVSGYVPAPSHPPRCSPARRPSACRDLVEVIHAVPTHQHTGQAPTCVVACCWCSLTGEAPPEEAHALHLVRPEHSSEEVRDGLRQRHTRTPSRRIYSSTTAHTTEDIPRALARLLERPADRWSAPPLDPRARSPPPAPHTWLAWA